MNVQFRARVLDHISDPSVQKTLVMRWWERGTISNAEAEQLILDRGISAA